MKLLDGKKVSLKIQEEIKKEVAELIDKGDRAPHLAAVLIGNNPASETYVRNKIKTCEKVGFTPSLYRFDDHIPEKNLLEVVHNLNEDEGVDGILVQLPLPDHISEETVIRNIVPEKDVDGFHPVNLGRMAKGLPCFIPATPLGIITLLERYKIETEGKHTVILGRSNIVGMPMSLLMARKGYPGNSTVTVCHSRTKNIAGHLKQADIIIAAIGKPAFVKADMIKPGAVIIDVGINRVEDTNAKRGYRLKGDVDFEQVRELCSYITPVPGGVGPMTIASLLKNTLKSARKEIVY